MTFGAHLPVYKTLPVDARGVLNGTDDSALDGDVRRVRPDRPLGKVRQGPPVNHPPRVPLLHGRNETLSDSKTLVNAENAYPIASAASTK
ncbi:MAG: hypothetical protein R3C01_12865 [Planctomycetaceae bacterium]